ncbi:MAG TPA: hypothetical protein VN706_01690 [Gemmatimonadaceae bacterium]|nr:hypothetical protein [Gemmatimonadaceae bacterium]
MAMLLLADAEWQAFSRQKTEYPAHKAMSRITRKATAQILEKKLGFNLKGWDAYSSIHGLYDQFAHAGAFTLALHLNLGTHATIVGGDFDAIKQPEYRGHIESLTRGASSLAELTRRIGMHTSGIS